MHIIKKIQCIRQVTNCQYKIVKCIITCDSSISSIYRWEMLKLDKTRECPTYWQVNYTNAWSRL